MTPQALRDAKSPPAPQGRPSRRRKPLNPGGALPIEVAMMAKEATYTVDEMHGETRSVAAALEAAWLFTGRLGRPVEMHASIDGERVASVTVGPDGVANPLAMARMLDAVGLGGRP